MSDNMQPIDEILDDESPDAKATEAYEEVEEFDPFEGMSDEELDAHIEDYGVYARVQPEHKTRIVEAWKSRDQIVAMTGDGVNDAPSIKRADIGVGMGITGTDVTKNVADMVLADDNFATIIGACEEGRRIYDNIRKVIQFLLSANLAEVFSVFIATLIGFTIFQPVQLLWVALAVPVTALGASLYQTADLGIAPYDYLSLGLRDYTPVPYFGCRVFTDALCALLCWLLGGLVGIGTLICAFCLGPFIQFFNGLVSERVLHYKPGGQ